MPKLKTCPFCGGEVAICQNYRDSEYEPIRYHIYCENDCLMDLQSMPEKTIVELWNRRTE